MEERFETETPLPVPAEQCYSLRVLAFARYYLETGNGPESARRAGYQGNPVALGAVARRLLSRDDVSNYIATHLRSMITAEEVGAIVSSIVRSDIGNFIDITEDGQPVLNLLKESAQSNLHTIKSLKPTKYGWQIEMFDKTAVLMPLAKAMLVQDQERHARRLVENFLAILPSDVRDRVVEELNRPRGAVIDADTMKPVEVASVNNAGPDLSWLQEPPESVSSLIQEPESGVLEGIE